jgi:hypothetical protein
MNLEGDLDARLSCGGDDGDGDGLRQIRVKYASNATPDLIDWMNDRL